MSYLVLARKTRPKTFSEVVGQKAVVRTLQNALSQGRVSHALIFSGVRGVGKTTLARIMAKALNCTDDSSVEPCNSCTSCQEINGGGSVDLVEIDGASNRGIQEIRELKENIRFMPTGSRYKIIIIDEVHMLTTEAFNALLKTLEEPPEHVYFMFATTELHRVPVTILSRCQRYELKRIESKELAAYFKSLAEREGVQIEPAALNLIVREASGSVRDGLSLLDQVFSYCGDSVRADDVVDILGLVGHQVIADLSKALLDGDITRALEVLDSTYAYGMDLKRFINDLLAWFRALVVCSISGNPRARLDMPEDDLAQLQECAREYSTQSLVLMFNMLVENLEKVGYSSRPRFALELALIKAVQVGEVEPVMNILGRLDEVLGELPSEGVGGKQSAGKKKTAIRSDVSRESNERATGQGYQSNREDQGGNNVRTGEAQFTGNKPVPRVVESGATGDNKPGNKEPVASGAVGNDVPVAPKELHNRSVRQNWNEFVEYVRDRKPWMASALQMAKSAQLQGDELVIVYDNSAGCTLLRSRENITPLTEFALDFFQGNFRIKFQVPDSSACEVDSSSGSKVQRERQALANDSLVLTAVDIFNGEVGDIRVGPRFRGPIDKQGEVENEKMPEN